ncbi:chain length determinant protein [Streptomyces sp. Act143]|uniref:chain length determinant protein n=1 Tax=Streptomyces sp. Act143 TaxID=2200760 RepID=UPI000D67B61B|nr:chain length determinant protein [Streptomyces sp. Act143]PWI13592.1 chain length determinant protein [Streptomyces sp. Act143]
MDLAEIFRVMRRRWYVLLPGLLVTAGLVFGVTRVVHVTYQSQSTVVLLNSQKATLAYDGNPFLSTQTSLTGMADSLARNLNSDDSVRDLKSRGAKGTFEAKLADNAQGPLLWLTVTGTDKASVLSSDKILTAYAEERLEQFQQDQSVASKAMIRMTTIVAPQSPVAQTKTRLEYMIMAGGAGLVLSLVAVFYVEARKRPRRPSAPEDGTADRDAAADVPVVEETLAIRRPPSWSQSAGNERATADGRSAAGPKEPRPVMAGASAAEPRDEESTHGHRPRTGQRDR